MSSVLTAACSVHRLPAGGSVHMSTASVTDLCVCVYLSSTHEFREGVGGASLGALTQLTERRVEGGLRHTEAQRHHLEQVAVCHVT